MVLHLAVQRIGAVVDELLPNYGADCPVAVVALASRGDELVLRGTLADIAERVRKAGVRRTAVIIVGRVLGVGGWESHLYSAARDRSG
jgi:precorrin-4/cobalt-precorrin-4 C11-methyltransferase